MLIPLLKLQILELKEDNKLQEVYYGKARAKGIS
jgi:hypothetical protein